jgi:hypothetical protein
MGSYETYRGNTENFPTAPRLGIVLSPNDAAGFASRYGPLSCSPLNGLLTLGFDQARYQAKPPACYRAPW